MQVMEKKICRSALEFYIIMYKGPVFKTVVTYPEPEPAICFGISDLGMSHWNITYSLSFCESNISAWHTVIEGWPF